ncbi:hypothetical protein QQF64_012342 [Cirrhinus molitorella]|uniref:Uncharacterized protein n=1 Tax=Cirrhinus molitorella TaxID=172907 RepID=A0ABR3LYX1_9TELE
MWDGQVEVFIGGGFGRGRTLGRRPTNRVQGGDDGGRSQGVDRRDPEQEEPEIKSSGEISHINICIDSKETTKRQRCPGNIQSSTQLLSDGA